MARVVRADTDSPACGTRGDGANARMLTHAKGNHAGCDLATREDEFPQGLEDRLIP